MSKANFGTVITDVGLVEGSVVTCALFQVHVFEVRIIIFVSEIHSDCIFNFGYCQISTLLQIPTSTLTPVMQKKLDQDWQLGESERPN